MSRSKAKGTAAETAVVRFLQAAGFAQAERRTLNGVKDRGDISGLPGVVIEVKNCARQELPAWVAEAELERDNDNAALGVVWHKARGTTDPGRWFVTMSGAQFAALLQEQQGLPAPAAETQPAAPGRRETVEYFLQCQQPDGTWETASSYMDALDWAEERLAAKRAKWPDFVWRMAQRTTTVAVHALPDCLTCRHWSCSGTGPCGALLDAWQRCDCTGPAAKPQQDGGEAA